LPPFSPRSRTSESSFIKNEFIQAAEVRLIDENGQQVGVLPTREALKRAQSLELDLVLIAPTAQPPVAKIVDYGKFLYEKKKEEQRNKARQKKSELKVLKVSFKTSDHDKMRQVSSALEFIKEGHKVRIEMQLKGREKSKKDIAIQQMQSLLNKMIDSVKVEQPVTVLNNAAAFTVMAKK